MFHNIKLSGKIDSNYDTLIILRHDLCLIVCAPGHTDINGNCTECPRNTVKESAGNGNCTACPNGLETENAGSDNFALCGEFVIFSRKTLVKTWAIGPCYTLIPVFRPLFMRF